jgi:hypothetical protein
VRWLDDLVDEEHDRRGAEAGCDLSGDHTGCIGLAVTTRPAGVRGWFAPVAFPVATKQGQKARPW